jgi:hypothetical protein
MIWPPRPDYAIACSSERNSNWKPKWSRQVIELLEEKIGYFLGEVHSFGEFGPERTKCGQSANAAAHIARLKHLQKQRRYAPFSETENRFAECSWRTERDSNPRYGTYILRSGPRLCTLARRPLRRIKRQAPDNPARAPDNSDNPKFEAVLLAEVRAAAAAQTPPPSGRTRDIRASSLQRLTWQRNRMVATYVECFVTDQST